MTTADVATAIEETVGLRPGSVSAAEARGIVDFEVPWGSMWSLLITAVTGVVGDHW